MTSKLSTNETPLATAIRTTAQLCERRDEIGDDACDIYFGLLRTVDEIERRVGQIELAAFTLSTIAPGPAEQHYIQRIRDEVATIERRIVDSARREIADAASAGRKVA